MGKVVAAKERRDHMARVGVTDEIWAYFKNASSDRNVTVNAYLATLVVREVTRLRAAAAQEATIGARQVATALEEVKELQQGLESIAFRLSCASASWANTSDGHVPFEGRGGYTIVRSPRGHTAE